MSDRLLDLRHWLLDYLEDEPDDWLGAEEERQFNDWLEQGRELSPAERWKYLKRQMRQEWRGNLRPGQARGAAIKAGFTEREIDTIQTLLESQICAGNPHFVHHFLHRDSAFPEGILRIN